MHAPRGPKRNPRPCQREICRTRNREKRKIQQRIPTQVLTIGANKQNVSNVRWSRARWVRECAEMARARAAEAFTRGGWASSSAQSWDTCRHRHGEANVRRARPCTHQERVGIGRATRHARREVVFGPRRGQRASFVGWRKEAQAAGSAERASHILAAFAGDHS